MILLGLGGNIPSATGIPPKTFVSAVTMLAPHGVVTIARSRVYLSPPWPAGDSPDFYNQAVSIETRLPPAALMQILLKVEAAHGRNRREKWGPRTLDLDIVDYRGYVTDSDHLQLPHPWASERAFVLKPVMEIAPAWRHPLSGATAKELLSALPTLEVDACQPAPDA